MFQHSRIFSKILGIFTLFSLLFGSVAFPYPVLADSTITVTTSDDELNTDGDCSLREAIQAANDDAVVDACTAGSDVDTITVPSGTYTLTLEGVDEDGNATGDLDIVTSLNINGAGASATIIRAGITSESGIDRVFDIFGTNTVSISNVTIANGYPVAASGGGIYSGDDVILTVANSSFQDNYADDSGGSIYNSTGILTVTDSTFSDNSVYNYGGGLYNDSGNLTITNSIFSSNSAFCGGGIYNNTGTVNVTSSTFSDNSVECIGGGISNFGTMNVTNSTFSGNLAANEGGGVFNSGDLTVTNSTFSANSAEYGGGIYNNANNLHLQNTILANSTNGEDCYNQSGTIATNINNLIETNGSDGNMCETPAITGDPSLGSTLIGSPGYFPLNGNSPAIDAGDETVCAAAPVNNESQNGVTRPQGSACDIGAFEATAPANIDVTIGGNLMGTYTLQPNTSQSLKFPVTGGPVEISGPPGSQIIASLNQWRRLGAGSPFTGVAQSMAIPLEWITDTYVMPRYVGNDPTLYNAILLANVDTVTRDINVTIGGTAINDTITIGPSGSQFVVYNGVVGGPIVVSSDTGADIVASLYELKRGSASTGYNGQSEMNGLPFTQLSDTYLIPMYFGDPVHVGLDARIFIANADTVVRDITVTIGGNPMGTYTLQPNTSQSLKFPVTGGPVEISGPPGSKIIASLNQWRRLGAGKPFTGVAQSMAIPTELITDTYVMPRYVGNDPTLYNAILLANVDTVTRDINVTIGGTAINDTITLGASQSQYLVYTGVVGGPIVVSSDPGSQIVASLYELKRGAANTGYNGQSEMNGLPFTQLSDTYLIPIYFGDPVHVGLDARLFIAVP